MERNNDLCIYVLTHARVEIPLLNELEGYQLVQAGSNDNPDFGYLRVNSGDNIAQYNEYYGEMTAYYWLWKNIKCDYIGIAHYHRYFIMKDHIVRKEEIMEILSQYDIIIPTKCCVDTTMEKQWNRWHFKEDLGYIKQSIEKNYPEQIEKFNMILGTKGFHAFNFFISKKELFDEYCSWLFPILAEVKEEISFDKYPCNSAKRVGAFASERLFNLWLDTKGLKEYEMRVIDYKKRAFLQ